MTFDEFAKQMHEQTVSVINIDYMTVKHGNRDQEGDETIAIYKDQNGKEIARSTVRIK